MNIIYITVISQGNNIAYYLFLPTLLPIFAIQTTTLKVFKNLWVLRSDLELSMTSYHSIENVLNYL